MNPSEPRLQLKVSTVLKDITEAKLEGTLNECTVVEDVVGSKFDDLIREFKILKDILLLLLLVGRGLILDEVRLNVDGDRGLGLGFIVGLVQRLLHIVDTRLHRLEARFHFFDNLLIGLQDDDGSALLESPTWWVRLHVVVLHCCARLGSLSFNNWEQESRTGTEPWTD
jgi:hypothetical protein